jgi:hypothetical protein
MERRVGYISGHFFCPSQDKTGIHPFLVNMSRELVGIIDKCSNDCTVMIHVHVAYAGGVELRVGVIDKHAKLRRPKASVGQGLLAVLSGCDARRSIA